MHTATGSYGGSTEVGWSSDHLPPTGKFGVFVADPFDQVLIPVKVDHTDVRKAIKQAYNTAYRREENVTVIDSQGSFLYTAYNGW
jgi:hypothetical protein